MQKNFWAEELVKIIDEYFASLILFTRQWSYSNADDIVQTAFMRLIKFIYENGYLQNIVAWLFTAIRNEANNQKRNKNRRDYCEEKFFQEKKVWFVPIETSTIELQEMTDSFKIPTSASSEELEKEEVNSTLS